MAKKKSGEKFVRVTLPVSAIKAYKAAQKAKKAKK